MKSTFPLPFIDIIKEQYHIVDIIDLADHDLELDSLVKTIKMFESATLMSNQCLVVLHQDTDYYVNLNSVGNTVYNFFKLCAYFSLPLEKVIFVTNHFGAENEIEKLARELCNSNPPKIIYTAQWWDYPLPNDIPDSMPASQHIDYLYCCLNGVGRQHRLFTLCTLKDNELLEYGMLSYHFNNEYESTPIENH